MNINEGNIFEAMRLVLPEHRGAMSEWKRQRSKREPPVLSEDEIQDMQYILKEALENGSKVRLKLFGEYSDAVIEGVPFYDGRLRAATDEGVLIVDVERLIAVDLM